jgi:hypothetical protein
VTPSPERAGASRFTSDLRGWLADAESVAEFVADFALTSSLVARLKSFHIISAKNCNQPEVCVVYQDIRRLLRAQPSQARILSGGLCDAGWTFQAAG